MVKQYPHSLYIATSAGDSYVNGEWVSSTKVWRRISECRFETSGRSSETNDGDTYQTGTIYAPTSCPFLSDRTAIAVVAVDGFSELSDAQIGDLTDQGEVKFNGVVKGYERSEFHVRIWSN